MDFKMELGKGGTIVEMVHALEPGTGRMVFDGDPTREQGALLVCQMVRSPDGGTYYLAGPSFNGDEVVTLPHLFTAGLIDEYNAEHDDPEHIIYTAPTAELALDRLRWLFDLWNSEEILRQILRD